MNRARDPLEWRTIIPVKMTGDRQLAAEIRKRFDTETAEGRRVRREE